MDRIKIYEILKESISQVKSEQLKYQLNILLSPLYLYAIICVEGKLEKRFKQLSISQQMKVLPGKLLDKFEDYRIRKFKKSVFESKDATLRQADILFYPVEPTHLKQMIPVSSYLEKNEYIYVTDRINIWRDLKKQGIDCHYLDLSNKKFNEQKQNIDKLNIVIEQIWKNINPAFVSNEWISFAKNLIINNYPTLESAFTELLDEVNPTKVVVGYDTTTEGRLITVLCKKRGVESVCIQHGSISGEPLDSEHIVDNFLLYGQKAKEYLINIGNNPDNLEVFGAPYLDGLVTSFSKRKEFLERLELNPDKKTVLIALSGPGHCTTYEHFHQIVSSIIKVASIHDEFNYIFKLHRKDRKENYLKIIKKYNLYMPLIDASNPYLPQDIFYWLNTADLLITGASTVALEAMKMNVPVLTIDYLNEYKDVDFIDLRCTFHVDDKLQLEGTLCNVMNKNEEINYYYIQQNAKEYISQYFHTEKNPASKRIAKWLIAN